MSSPNVVVNGITYTGVARLSIPLTTGGYGDFVYIGAEPGSLTQWQANVKINKKIYNAVRGVILPISGGGTAKYICAAGTFTTYKVYPGSPGIKLGDFVKLLPGLVPSTALYPSASLYPSTATMATGLGTDSTYAEGIAMGDAKAGGTVLVYIPKT